MNDGIILRRACIAVEDGNVASILQVRGRWAKVIVSGEMAVRLFTDSEWLPASEYALKIVGVPRGARIIDAIVDRLTGRITFLLEHESWDLTTEASAPVVCPKFEMEDRAAIANFERSQS